MIRRQPKTSANKRDYDRRKKRVNTRKAGKPFWTTERKKLVIMLASAAVVIALAKWVQVWLRGY